MGRAMSEFIGQTIGQYKIIALLGEGGMATVYRAQQPNMHREVAIKIIESRLARNPEFTRRFEHRFSSEGKVPPVIEIAGSDAIAYAPNVGVIRPPTPTIPNSTPLRPTAPHGGRRGNTL